MYLVRSDVAVQTDNIITNAIAEHQSTAFKQFTWINDMEDDD